MLSLYPDKQSDASDGSNGSIDARLRKDLERIEARVNSDAGVPVFLCCVNLAVNNTLQKPPKPALTDLNTKLAAEFRETAAAWERIRPNPAAGRCRACDRSIGLPGLFSGWHGADVINQDTPFQKEAAELEELFATQPLIRAVNFHSTPKANAAHYEKQLAEYRQHFTSVDEDELDEYLTTGRWHKAKPGLIVSVFEGYRNSFEVLLPLIEKHGFIGWFWMITSFINAPVPDQLNYADHHDIDMMTHEYPDGRYALTWEELRQIDKKHVIASHTRSHTLLSQLPPEVQREEVIGSQEGISRKIWATRCAGLSL